MSDASRMAGWRRVSKGTRSSADAYCNRHDRMEHTWSFCCGHPDDWTVARTFIQMRDHCLCFEIHDRVLSAGAQRLER